MLIAGCSHAAGSEINGLEDSVYNRQHCFGAHVARHFGYTPINIAQNGLTNTGIARSIQKWFEKEYDPETMQVFVLVAWTESTRMEIPSNRMYYYNWSSKSTDWFDETANMYMRVTFGWEGGDPEEKSLIPFYHRFMAENEVYLELQALQNILMTQYFLKSMNVDYLMCSSLHICDINRQHTQEFLQLIDHNKYYELYADSPFYIKYKKLNYVNEKAKYWHHGEEPHQLFAQELIQFIEEKQWEL